VGKADRTSGAFWFLFSLLLSYESYKLGLGTVRQPGPGFLFFWTSIIIAFLALTVFLTSLKKKARTESIKSVFVKSSLLKLLLVLSSLFIYALLIEWLGFLIVTLLLFLFLLGVIEKKNLGFTILVSLAVTALSYLIFEVGLESQLPKGPLEFLRF